DQLREKKRRHHGIAPSNRCCDEGILPGFGGNGIIRRVQAHDRKEVFTASSTASFFLSSRSTVLGQICNDRAVSRTPLALRLMSMIVCLTSGKHPRLQ